MKKGLYLLQLAFVKGNELCFPANLADKKAQQIDSFLS